VLVTQHLGELADQGLGGREFSAPYGDLRKLSTVGGG
jgi:hypothetical protein